MIYKFSVYIFLLCAQYLVAQNVSLHWEANKAVYEHSYSSESFPYFSNPGYSLVEGIPYYSYSTDSFSGNQVKIENLNWELVQAYTLGDMPVENIPEVEKYYANIVKSKQTPKAIAGIYAFKKIDNQIYRLTSFNLSFSNSSSAKNFQTKITFANSRLSSGDYYKISVDTTGIYKLDYSFFQASGLNPSAITPSKIKIFGNGGAMLSERIDDFRFEDLEENAIKVVDGGDGSFDTNDYILFYAQGPHSLKRNILTQPIHITNLYEDKAYYYIKTDGINGLRIQDQNSLAAATYLSTYDDIRVIEPETTNVNELGRIWVGENFGVENTQTYNFTANSIDNTTPVRCNLSVFGQNNLGHTIDLDVNGSSVISTASTTNLDYRNLSYTANTTISGSNINAVITVDNSANPAGNTWFNYLEFYFKQNLSYNGSQMNFRRLDNINNGNTYGFRISNPSGMEEVWNVSNWTKPANLISHSTGGTFDFSYNSTNLDFPNEFIAFNQQSAYTPEFIGKIENQNLHGLQNIDYLVISPEEFKSEAQKIADYHSGHSNYNTAVVSPEDIYTEFSSGSQDITAIRDFVRYVYQRNNTLKYLLLFGDTSYDFKDRIPNNQNLIPSYQSLNSDDLTSSFVTDDYYGILDDGEANSFPTGDVDLNSSQLDIAIGRMTVANQADAQAFVKKNLSYDNVFNGQSSPFGIWRLKTHIVVDDDNTGDPFHEDIEPGVSNYLYTQRPLYSIRKLYLDAFQQETTSGGPRYPDVNAEIDNAFETGSLFLNYFGHGGPRGWTQERVISQEQIESYNNLNNVFTRLPLISTVTCDFTVWDNPNLVSSGEFLVKKDDGGVIGSITTSRAIGVAYGKAFNPILVKNLFELVGNRYKTFGDALTDSKISYNGNDNYKTNLLGDPALSLYLPPRNIKLNTINGQPASTFNGVLRALDFITIEGEVLEDNNTNKDTNFNGTVEIELYDKAEQKTTLNNDGTLGTMTYPEQVTRVYSGSSQVDNGDFTLEFYIPKDINYNIGNGKLVLYADNNEIDAKYFKNDIQIGDINPAGIDDDEPPVAQLYLNNRHFANGGITNKDPIFIACVTDSTGINTTGVGVGHDITLVIDNAINDTRVLNAYYQGGEQTDCPNPSLQDYQKGMVTYNLKDVEVGDHTLTFKVWDINNNSTTETLDFTVVQEGDAGIVINRLLNWPNPFTDKTFFHFEHNCDGILEVQVQIFTISGKLIKTIRQPVSSSPYREGYRTDKFGIEWDGLDDYGDKIGKGTYVFKATVKGSDEESCSGTASAIEKLVILK